MSCYSYAAVIICHRPLKYTVEYYLITDTIHKKFCGFPDKFEGMAI